MTARRWARLAAGGALASALVGTLAGCASVGDDPDFGNGSPRPECRTTQDPNRVPYASKPTVVAPEYGEPVKLPGPVTDDCPNDAVEITRDGRALYFFWSPLVRGTPDDLLSPQSGTYRAERVGPGPGDFGEPTYFELQKGVEGQSIDGEVSFTPDGSQVYFQSTREGNTGLVAIDPTDDYLDIYVADVVDGVPGVARNVGEPVNSSSPDGEHALSPDGTRLYITSNRPGSVGGTDIWVAEKTGDAWGEPVALPAPINTDANELQPAFAADDPDTMYFVSDRTGEATIYRSTFADGAWSEPEVVVTGYVGEPSLVADGSVLYFVQVLIDDKGIYGSNIWYTERTA